MYMDKVYKLVDPISICMQVCPAVSDIFTLVLKKIVYSLDNNISIYDSFKFSL